LYFLVHFCIKILKKNKKILIIIQRSNGDVFLSSSLIKALYENYNSPQIDLLVNIDTLSLAKLIPFVRNIYTFSYFEKQKNRWIQEKKITLKIFKKYDLSINLTASDRSVFYALMAGRTSISAVENDIKKSWWKKIFLTHYYCFDNSRHIIENNLKPLNLLKIESKKIHYDIGVTSNATSKVKKKLEAIKVTDFVIFHPSTQYSYKIYPSALRNNLLSALSTLNVPILITGGFTRLDLDIKKHLPSLPNIIDFIGETSLEEFFALSKLSLGYIGMDTLNMHIAASQNKRIFAIFGPTNLVMWSPWSNQLRLSATEDNPIQTYGNITIFQADMPCVACGKAGCDDNHGNSNCLDNISPVNIFNEVQDWYLNSKYKIEIPIMTEIEKSPRNILLYIVYGNDQTYYDGAVFSFLTFMHWMDDSSKIEIVILTEKPDKFLGYPVQTIKITDEQKDEWSLNGLYHFRIKNRGLAFVMDELQVNGFDKILFFDTDTYFHKSPLPLFDLITADQALFYLNEGLIYDRKRFFIYIDSLEGKEIKIDEEYYLLSRKSAMWGSLMIGISANMRPSLDWADKLMLKFFDLVPAHTIEPFSLSESLLRKYNLVEGKNFVKLYSTSRKKEHAKDILAVFFDENKLLTIDDQVRLAQSIKIKRTFYKVIKQRLQKIMSK